MSANDPKRTCDCSDDDIGLFKDCTRFDVVSQGSGRANKEKGHAWEGLNAAPSLNGAALGRNTLSNVAASIDLLQGLAIRTLVNSRTMRNA